MWLLSCPLGHRWCLVTTKASTGKAVFVNYSFYSVLSSKLPLKCSVSLSLEDAGRLESSL